MSIIIGAIPFETKSYDQELARSCKSGVSLSELRHLVDFSKLDIGIVRV